MRACDQDSNFSTGGRFRPDWASIGVTRSYSSHPFLQVGAWAGLEAGMSLWLTDFKLLVQGLQGVTENVGLNNSGLLLEVRLVGESQVGELGAGEGESYSEQIFYYPYGLLRGTA